MSDRACFWAGESLLFLAFSLVCKKYPLEVFAVWFAIQGLYWLGASLKGGFKL